MLKHFRVPGRLAVKLDELGVSVPDVLRRAGLPRDLFEQTRALVSTRELFALWRAIDQVSSDPLIGVKLGVETKTERFHPMAIVALSTENLVTASKHMARYKKLTAPEEILVELDQEEFTVGFRWLLAVEDEPSSLTDYCFSWMRSLARHGSGTAVTPLRAEYVQQRSNLRQLERSLGCGIAVGAPPKCNRLSYLRRHEAVRYTQRRTPRSTRPAVRGAAATVQRRGQFPGACAAHDPGQTHRPSSLNRRNF
jgi:Arabinose-binding domain of AraC transcription regulator, N-term